MADDPVEVLGGPWVSRTDEPSRSNGDVSGEPRSMAVSIDASTSRVTSSPSEAMHLNPLNSGGLWEAVTMIPSCAPTRGMLYWIAGVGSKPRRTTR